MIGDPIANIPLQELGTRVGRANKLSPDSMFAFGSICQESLRCGTLLRMQAPQWQPQDVPLAGTAKFRLLRVNGSSMRQGS
jgi:hypothetical protein